MLAKQLRAAGLLRLDPVGRTLFFASLIPLPLCGIAIGCVVAVLYGDPWSAAHVRARYAETALAQFWLVMAALSVSTVWLEMVDKVKSGQRRHAAVSSSNDAKALCGVSYGTVALAAALASSVTAAMVLVAVADPLLTSFLFLPVLPVVGASFAVASNRIYAALIRVVPHDGGGGGSGSAGVGTAASPATSALPPLAAPASSGAVPPSVLAMAGHVRKTARGMGARFMAIGCASVSYGLSRPSPSPVYAQQNSLPPLLSGQLAFFLLCALVIETSTYMASYLRFWKDRRVRPAAANHAPRPPKWWGLVSRAQPAANAEWSEASNSSLTNPPYQEAEEDAEMASGICPAVVSWHICENPA